MNLTRVQACIDIALMVALIVISGLIAGELTLRIFGDLRLPVFLMTQGLAVLFSIAILLKYRGQTWKHIGLSPFRPDDIGRAAVALLSCIGVNLVLNSFILWLDPDQLDQHVKQLTQMGRLLDDGGPLPSLMGLMLFVGIYEELTARGFLLSRCRIATTGTALPIIISALLFGIGHAYQGWVGVLQTTLVGIVLAVFTLRWKTLWPAILAHATLNTMSLVAIKTIGETSLS